MRFSKESKRVFMILCVVMFVFQAIAFSADIPKEEIDKLTKGPDKEPAFQNAAQKRGYFVKYMKSKGGEAQALLKRYPDAKNVYKVREVIMMVTINLARMGEDSSVNKTRALEQAKLILEDANAPKEVKIGANVVKYSTELQGLPPKFVKSTIDEFFESTAKLDEKYAYKLAIELSMSKRQKKLAIKYLNQAIEKYPDEKVFQQYKARLIKKDYTGEPFKAELTKLDGKKIYLPKDYLGKVVIIDFWASWCSPCRVYARSSLKKIYKKYKDKDVVIIGVSLDTDRKRLDAYLAKTRYGWIQTYSGDGFDDETARRYGIQGIPSVWVIDKEGKIVTDQGRGNLNRILPQLVK